MSPSKRLRVSRHLYANLRAPTAPLIDSKTFNAWCAVVALSAMGMPVDGLVLSINIDGWLAAATEVAGRLRTDGLEPTRAHIVELQRTGRKLRDVGRR